MYTRTSDSRGNVSQSTWGAETSTNRLVGVWIGERIAFSDQKNLSRLWYVQGHLGLAPQRCCSRGWHRSGDHCHVCVCTLGSWNWLQKIEHRCLCYWLVGESECLSWFYVIFGLYCKFIVFGLGYFWGLMLIYLIFGRVFKLGCGPKSFAECYPFLWVSKNCVWTEAFIHY